MKTVTKKTPKIEYNPKTKTYSCRITIGDKNLIKGDPKSYSTALKRAIMGVTNRVCLDLRDKQLTDILFWVEEGVL